MSSNKSTLHRHQSSTEAQIIERCLEDQDVRIATVNKSHYWFFHVYFNHYVKHKTAPFQQEMFALTKNDALRTIVITAFRGSAKSTIMNMSLALWSILGKPGQKFILLVGQTQVQARQHLKNIKDELETNAILRHDLGPFREEEDEWRNSCLVISNYNAKIMAVSIDQSVRGLRHRENRPDLIICDDIEDLQSVKTREGRDKTYRWVKGELIPAGDTGTKLVFIGNLLHEDCLLKRLQREMGSTSLQGAYREYPLLDSNDACLWPGKYPDRQAVNGERERIGSEAAWQREYLLHILPDSEQLVHREWIHFYDELPPQDSAASYAVGIDLAISVTASADYTAMVSARIEGNGDSRRFYILPNPVNEKLNFFGTIDRAKALTLVQEGKRRAKLYVEDVGYQRSAIETLRNEGCLVEGVPTYGQDKRARLSLVTHLIQSGRVLFPSKGAERLIEQLVGFGTELHDDLADAFAILLLPFMTEEKAKPCAFNRLEIEDWIILNPCRTKMKGRMMIWKEPIKNQRYMAVCDTTPRRGIDQGLEDSEAEGGGTDYSVIQIWNPKTLQMVAMFRAKWPYAKLHEPLMQMAQEYNNAYIIVEATDHGLTVLHNLKRNDYPQWLIHRERVVDKNTKTATKKMGFYTNSKTRPIIIDELATNIKEGYVRVHSRDVQSECLRFVIHDDRQPAAMDGYNENCVMAMAIATYPENVRLAVQALNPTQVTKRDLGL
ncbi:hypothetical protein COU77_04300 [Candidatus Peregrinibacteria bacterium CG10_big_fil_rev_8_21_14_0_10_49_16]|nr:MAG: hypothetical protein COU77_04300 [Candidatus Peregrinibacteria bacterium CG10_big_fil_rev_8_21_14_0_10_49_16]